MPLLEVLRRVLPHAANHGNNAGALVAHQFGNVVRTMRMFVALAHALPGGEPAKGGRGGGGGGGAAAGSNALLRQVLLVSTSLVLCAPAGVGEEDAARALHATVVPLFHDARPKVRKAAFAAGLEIIVASSSSSGDSMDDGVDPDVYASLRRRRRGAADRLWEYCHAVLSECASGKSSNKKDGAAGGRMNHVLRFLSAGLPHADDPRIRVKFGEACLVLMGGDSISRDSARECLSCLLSCVDDSDGESLGGGGVGGGSKGGEDELAKFAARSLAFLLQHRPSSGGSNGDVGATYARCLLACVVRMTSSSGVPDHGNPSPTAVLATKLLPSALRSVLHLCDSDGDGSECGAEFNRLVSLTAPRLASSVRAGGDGRRVALEAAPQIVAVMEETLQVKYRGEWGAVLPGGYARFVTELAGALLDARGAREPEVEDAVGSWMRSLVASLLRLHGDTRKDGPARSSVEYAAATVARGTGVELFLELVDLSGSDDVDDHGMATTTSGTAAGGGVRDDLAWLLPHLRQASSDTLRRKARLASFQGRVLPLARRCDAASADPARTAAEASVQRSRVAELWSLFPAYCLEPVDVRDGLAPVARVVVKALGDHGRYPKLVVSLNFCLFCCHRFGRLSCL